MYFLQTYKIHNVQYRRSNMQRTPCLYPIKADSICIKTTLKKGEKKGCFRPRKEINSHTHLHEYVDSYLPHSLCVEPNFLLFVSPELSSGRDLVIQMSVRHAACGVHRPPSAVHGFLSGVYLGNRMTYLDDIWYVGGSRSEVAHAEFWAWQMPIKYLICIIYAKICPEHFSGTVCPTWMIFGMWVGLGPKVPMVTLMEVKGHQRSNGVNYVLWLPYLVKRSPDAS